jgi:type II secretory pathway component PulF
MEFKYKALYENRLVEGVVEAHTKTEAALKLKNQGFRVISIRELYGKKVKSDSRFLEEFSKQLLQLLRAGLTIDKAILFIAESNRKYHNKLMEIYRELRSGSTLSSAMKASGIFPLEFTEVIRSGEEAGSLEETLELILNFIRESNELKSSIRTALIYPSFLLGVSLVALMVISMYVVPKFRLVFESIDAEIPLLTRAVFGFTDFLNYLIVAFLSVSLLLLLYVRWAMGREDRREALERLLLKIPVVGDFLLSVEVMKFAQTMFTLLKGGVVLNNALSIASGVVSLLYLRKRILKLSEEVLKGVSLSTAMKREGIFPQIAVEIAAVGEQTGELGGAFYQIYITLSDRFRTSVRRFLTLLEPSIILIMGLVVGIIVFSMMLAVFSISGSV